MNFSFLFYSAILAFKGIDQETLPQRCWQIKSKINIMEYAERVTGYHDEKGDEYHELLTQKSKLMDCDNKNGASDKYLKRNADHTEHNMDIFLHNAHCIELNKFLAKHAENVDSCDSATGSTQVKLLADVKKEATDLKCQYRVEFIKIEEESL